MPGTSVCRTVTRPGGAYADEQPEELVRSTLEFVVVPGASLVCEVEADMDTLLRAQRKQRHGEVDGGDAAARSESSTAAALGRGGCR
jgi:hypothetical protein